MPLDRRALLGLAADIGTPALADPPVVIADLPEIVPLWPARPPGAQRILPLEAVVNRVQTSGFQDRFVTGIVRPLMTVFRPAKPNGAALLIAPGGGYIR